MSPSAPALIVTVHREGDVGGRGPPYVDEREASLAAAGAASATGLAGSVAAPRLRRAMAPPDPVPVTPVTAPPIIRFFTTRDSSAIGTVRPNLTPHHALPSLGLPSALSGTCLIAALLPGLGASHPR
jgi:hypothetical protein